MCKDHLLKLYRRERISLDRLLAGQFLYRRKPFALRGIGDKNKYNHCSDKSSYCREDETVLPPEGTDNHSYDNE